MKRKNRKIQSQKQKIDGVNTFSTCKCDKAFVRLKKVQVYSKAQKVIKTKNGSIAIRSFINCSSNINKEASSNC